MYTGLSVTLLRILMRDGRLTLNDHTVSVLQPVTKKVYKKL